MLFSKKPAGRWRVAQSFEQKSLESTDDLNEWIRVRRHTWRNLINLLSANVVFDNSTRVLDIGCSSTSIFLGLANGEKYALDPNINRLFSLHPFLLNIAEYKDVNFVNAGIEELSSDKPFDVIFMINMLDHVDDLTLVTSKIDKLLSRNGKLILIVDCYDDLVVRNIISSFDVDLPHPHHFMLQDIYSLFGSFKLIMKIRADSIYDELNFRNQKNSIEIYRVDKFLNRMKRHLIMEGDGTLLFTIKYLLCYTIALSVATIRRKSHPIHPLKKPWLFVFKKDS